MIGAAAPVRDLVPHAGAMVLLDRVERWDTGGVLCRAASHLDPANPLRRGGRLAACCGLEYAMQAAALHGALLAGGVAQPAGYVAALRDVVLHPALAASDRLDDPAWGELRVEARLERQESAALAYALVVSAADFTPLLSGRASIALPAAAGG